MTPSFEELVDEAASAPIRGWDFSWLEGRATEERPWWRYHRLAAQAAAARAVLDLQTGGGELLAEIVAHAPDRPAVVVAAESWPPNVSIARHNLAPVGARVVETADDAALPFNPGTFDLILSRHPVSTRWDEVSRVLRPKGAYLGQHVGPGSNLELTGFLMGPQPPSERRHPARAVADARSSGLRVLDLRTATLRVQFFDIGSVVYFLRLVVWTVPDFDVERYRDRLLELHRVIERRGPFVSHARRFLIRAVKPG